MINIFDKYDEQTRDLHNSLKLAGYDFPTIVLDDDGHLEAGLISPYQYFMGEENYTNLPLYFNKIDKPDLWEIESSNEQGVVYDYSKERARIFYVNPKEKRLVRTVEWKDENGKVRSVEYYNRYGRKYGHTVYNKEGKSTFSTYYHISGREAIVENHQTGAIIVSEENGSKVFTRKIDLIYYFLEITKLDTTNIIYNRLSLPFLSVYYLNKEGKDFLVWQENIGNEIPGNMLAALAKKERNLEVLVTNKSTYEKILELIPEEYKGRIHLFGNIYRPVRESKFNNKILIATNSDQILNLEELVLELPEFEFNIVALTEMSSKLMNFDKYNNVNLYPNVRTKKMTKLMAECSYYLDINSHNEILNSVRKAFDNNMIILGFEETLHNKAFISEENIFKNENWKSLAAKLKEINEDKRKISDELEKQRTSANNVGENLYHKFFEFWRAK